VTRFQGGISGVGQRLPHRYPGCYWAQFSTEPCNGPVDPCHVLPQRLLKRLHANANPRLPTAWHCPSALTGTDLDALLADRRNIVDGCRHHHAQADNFGLDYEIPESAREFAAELDLSHHLPAREMRAA